MGIFDRFPYSSTHEMNLDFMLGKATEIAEDMQTVTTGMAQVQAGLSAISEKTEQATQAAAQAAQSASSIEGSVTAAEEAAEEAQMHNESAQTWANNAMTYKADCQRSATEAAASSSSAAQAATAAAASEDTVATYAQAANASAQSAANNNDSAHQYANQASASASNATFHSSNAQTAATNAQTAATNANTSATNAAASADRAASLKTDVETLHRMCTAAVDQAATEAVNAANSAAQAAASKTDVENLVESLPEDFTDLNNTVNQLSDEKVNKPTNSPNGTSGQLLRTNGDGTTTWVDQGLPTDAQTAEAVSDWLNAHPEATTAVQDGSLTYLKFANGTLDIVTPQMFGAIADGSTDDTAAINSAITFAKNNGRILYFPKGNYKVTETIAVGDIISVEMDTQATIVSGAPLDYVVSFIVSSYLTQRLTIKNIKIDGNSMAKNGVYFRGISNSGSISVAGLICKNCTEDGIVFENCQGGVFEAVKSENNGRIGVKIIGCNNAKFISISSMANASDGVKIQKAITESASGAVYIFGLHSETNQGYGIHIVDGLGLTSIYSGWLEGNQLTPIKIEDNSKCVICGLRIVWGVATPFAEINSDYAIIRDIEIQGGSGAVYDAAVTGTSIIENIQSAVDQTWEIFNTKKSEMLLSNIIDGGDMQGSGGFNIYYSTYTYQDQTIVESGKTYSLKCVLNQNAFAINKDSVSGLTIGNLYKVKAKIYVDGHDCKFRMLAGDNTNNKFCYSPLQDAKAGQWSEIVGYFYAFIEGPYRIGLQSYNIDAPQSGDTIYVSELYCQPCVSVEKISTKRIGETWVYESIEPAIMTPLY